MLKEEIIVTTHLRNAAGVCALSIGLLVCSSTGAIAFADQTDTGGVATGAQGASSTTGDKTTGDNTTATGPVSSSSDQQDEEESAEGATTGLTANLAGAQSSTSNLDEQTDTSLAPGDDKYGAGAVDLETEDAEIGTAPISVVETPPTQAITPAPLELTPPPPVGSDNNSPAPTTPAGHENSSALTTASMVKKWADLTGNRELGQITDAVLIPVTDAVISIARALGKVTFTLVKLPTSKTPVTDVFVSVSIMVGTVLEAAVEVAQVPGDLVTLLGNGSVGVDRPSLIGAGGAVERVVSASAAPPPLGVEAIQPMQLPGGFAEAPLLGTVVQPSTIGGAATSGLKTDLSISGLAPVPSGINPATTSFLDHVVSSVLVPASLTALAAIAVPGVAGLLIVCVAGVRVGYRQAKAGLALRVSGIARFAGPGPMGVVRSGGLIALHTRGARLRKPHTTRVVSAKTADAPRLLESVA